jgi:hypothetical protein
MFLVNIKMNRRRGTMELYPSSGCHLHHVGAVETSVLKANGNIFHWRVWRKVTDYCLYRLFGFGRKGKIVKIFSSQ